MRSCSQGVTLRLLPWVVSNRSVGAVLTGYERCHGQSNWVLWMWPSAREMSGLAGPVPQTTRNIRKTFGTVGTLRKGHRDLSCASSLPMPTRVTGYECTVAPELHVV